MKSKLVGAGIEIRLEDTPRWLSVLRPYVMLLLREVCAMIQLEQDPLGYGFFMPINPRLPLHIGSVEREYFGNLPRSVLMSVQVCQWFRLPILMPGSSVSTSTSIVLSRASPSRNC